MKLEVDVLIVGGGPAGLSAGISLAGCGVRTLICERKRLPVDKACGEGIMPTGLAHLERLGVKQHLYQGNYQPFAGIRYISPGGQTASAPFQEGPGWGVPRVDLSAGLLRRARELADLKIIDGVSVKIGRIEDGRVQAQVGEELVSARLVVGADGLNSQVRRWARLQGPAQPLQRWGARQHFPLTPWSDYVEVYMQGGLEAYVTPCGPSLIGIAFLWDRARTWPLPGGKALIPSLLEAFPELLKRLDGVQPCDAPRSVGPMYRAAKRPASDGVLLIGDAAGYLDAITGEGISLATAQALALRETVVPVLRTPGREILTAQDLAAYSRAYHSIVRPYYRITRLVLWLSQHPAWVEMVIKILQSRPGLFQQLLSANMGLVSFREILRKALIGRGE